MLKKIKIWVPDKPEGIHIGIIMVQFWITFPELR